MSMRYTQPDGPPMASEARSGNVSNFRRRAKRDSIVIVLACAGELRDNAARSYSKAMVVAAVAGDTGERWGMRAKHVESNDLRRAGLKVTLPRMKILEILGSGTPRHMSAED